MSLLTHLICSCMWPMFPVSTHGTLITSLLNSWSGDPNNSVISEAGSDICFISVDYVSSCIYQVIFQKLDTMLWIIIPEIK